MIRLINIALIGLFSFTLPKTPINNHKTVTSINDFKQAVVVELFSSEGCSSCPPAEALLNKIKAEADKNNTTIFTLAFHVNYWDYIGWKDKLALPLSTDRQYAYCKQLQSNPYTPQTIVNGTIQMVGSNEREEKDAISNALKISTDYTIMASATSDKNKIDINYTVSSNTVNKDYDIQIALVEDNIVTSVKRGENAGKTLTHNSVVRSFTTEKISATNGKKSILIPTELNTANLRLVLFVQNSRNLHILNACIAKINI
jgi:hypothetical protein